MLPYAISEMFMTPKQAANQVVIRKYANRRLYDTNASRYVTIDDLKLMGKNSLDVRVVIHFNHEELPPRLLDVDAIQPVANEIGCFQSYSNGA